MRIITAFVRRHPLVAFFVLAYALTWPVIPLVSLSPLLGFPGLFGPAPVYAVAALVLSVVVGPSLSREPRVAADLWG